MTASAMPRNTRSTRRSAASGLLTLGVCAAAASAYAGHSAFVAGHQAAAPLAQSAVALRAAQKSPPQQINNPVKTVSDSINDFYKAYPSPPVLPMFRAFLIDALTSTHLAVVDSRFKYDSVFALGMKEWYFGIMGNYDKLMGGTEEVDKIWKAYCASLGFDAAKVTADAEAAVAYAKGTAPATILGDMEGAKGDLGESFGSISKGLYSMPFSVGLFTVMKGAGVELSKANVEEWAKALKVTAAKTTSDLETYKQNQNKLQKAEEMIREIEIREKKKLAQALEEKAKALAAKAAGKKEE